MPQIRSLRRFEATAYVNAGELLFDISVELESGERSIFAWSRSTCGFAGHTRQSESFQQGHRGRAPPMKKPCLEPPRDINSPWRDTRTSQSNLWRACLLAIQSSSFFSENHRILETQKYLKKTQVHELICRFNDEIVDDQISFSISAEFVLHHRMRRLTDRKSRW